VKTRSASNNLRLASILCLGISGAISHAADLNFPLDCRSTYLYTSQGDNGAQAPLIIKLSDYGLNPGDRINLKEQGVYALGGGFAENSTMISGVFSKDGIVLDRHQRRRVDLSPLVGSI
jgi:hypothetical protein